MHRSFSTLFILVAFGAQLPLRAQVDDPMHVLQAIVGNGDTIPLVQLTEAEVQARWRPKDRREAERYDKLVRQVVKVYPYARLTGQLLKEYEHDLSLIEKNNDQELYTKILNKFAYITRAVHEGVPPLQDYTKDSKPCRVCDFRERCWAKEEL